MAEGINWRVGDVIADLYEVRGINTEGGMATVYFVYHRGWGLELVIKSPRREVIVDDSARARFLQEAETWVDLGLHPNIVTAHYAREIEGFPRIVIEKMDGGSLKQRMEAGKVRDLATALDVAIQVASGIAYAQRLRAGFVHRDIKPANVLMTPDGQAKVTDFGLAGAAGGRVGTPAYMAPEVWTSPADVDARADLYSFGILLYELLAGRRPFLVGEEDFSLGGIAAGTGIAASMGGLRYGRLAGPGGAEAAATIERSIGERLDVQRLVDRSLGEQSGDAATPSAFLGAIQAYRDFHVSLRPRPPCVFVPGLDPGLNDLCLALLAKDPASRPGPMAGVVDRLKAFYERLVGASYPRESPRQASLDTGTLNNRALSMLDLGENREAQQWWMLAGVDDPSHLETTFNFGYLEWLAGRQDDLQYVRKLDEIGRVHGDRTEYWQGLGRVHFDRGDHDAAGRAEARLPESDRLSWQAKAAAPFMRHEATAKAPMALSSLSVARDDSVVVAGGKKGWLGLFDGDTLELLRICPDGSAYDQRAVAFWGAPFFFTGTHGYDIAIYRTEDGQPLGLFKMPASPDISADQISAQSASALAVSRDIDWLASAYHFGMGVAAEQPIVIWNLKTGDVAARLKGHPDSVYAMAMLPSNQFIVSGGPAFAAGRIDSIEEYSRGKPYIEPSAPSPHAGGFLRLWDVATGGCLSVFPDQTSAVHAIGLSENGRLMVTGDDDGAVRVWRLREQRVIVTMTGHRGRVRAALFVRGDRFVATAGEDGTVRVWDFEAGRCLRTLEGHGDTVTALAWMPSKGRLLSAGVDGTVRAWALAPSGQRMFTYMLSKPRSTGELLRAESSVRTACQNADRALDAGRFGEAYAILRGAQQVEGRAHDAEVLDRLDRCTPHGRRASLRHAEVVAVFEQPSSPVTKLRFSPDGYLLAFAEHSGTVHLATVLTSAHNEQFAAHPQGVHALAWTADSQHIVCGSRGARRGEGQAHPTVQRFDPREGAKQPGFGAVTRPIGALCLTADGQVLTGDWGERLARSPAEPGGGHRDPDNLIRLWTAAGDVERASWPGHEDAVTALAIAPDGRTAASGSRDRTVRIFGLEESGFRHVCAGHRGGVFDVAFSSDGSRLVSAGGDDRLLVWDVRVGALVGELAGHRDTVHAAAFAPGLPLVFSGSEDTSVALWDTASGERLRTFDAHTDAVCAIDVSADGRFLATGGRDRRVRIWTLDWNWEFVGEGG